jgi:DHA1 family inner membrane transport protein
MSYVVGLPLGAWLGTRYGWRTPVFGLAAIVGLMVVLVGAWVPRANRAPGASFSGLGSLLRQSEVVRSLALTLLYFCAIFSVFAYSGPVLQALNPMSPEKLSATLMIFGLAGMAGTLSGGWASDRFGPIRTLRVQLLTLTSMMLLVPLTQGRYPLMVAVFIVWGIAGFGMMSPTQARLVNISPRQAPMLFSLNSSMLYAGTALGAAVGGISSAAFGFSNLAWAGAGFAVLGTFTLVSAKR